MTDLETFLRSIGRLSPGDRIYIRCLPPKNIDTSGTIRYGMARYLNAPDGDKYQPFIPRGYIEQTANNLQFTAINLIDKGRTFPDAIAYLEAINQKGYGIYFVVNPGGELDEDITHASCVFIEADDDKNRQRQIISNISDQFGCTPTVIETANSLHTYWLLSENITDLQEWRIVQKRLIQLAGSDPSIWNPSRLMRLPGFKYPKWDQQKSEIVFKTTPIQLDQTGDSQLSIIDLYGQLPEYNPAQWNDEPEPELNDDAPPVTDDRPVSDQISSRQDDEFSNEFLSYFNLANFASYLDGFSDGRSGWFTARCPFQGPGHSSNPSNDSLHINRNGTGFKCHAGCAPKDVHSAALRLAQARGYPSSSEWQRQRQQRQLKTQPVQQMAEHPDQHVGLPTASVLTLPPPVSESDHPIIDDQDTTDDPPSAPAQELPENIKRVLERHPSFTGNTTVVVINEQAAADDERVSAFLAAILEKPLSRLGQYIVDSYVWIATSRKYFNAVTGLEYERSAFNDLYNDIELFESRTRWLDYSAQAKPKFVRAEDLLTAHRLKCEGETYQPGCDRILDDPHHALPLFNRWRSPLAYCQDQSGVTAADIAPWLDHVTALFETEERTQYVLQFLAHCIQRPAEKSDFALVFYTEQRRSGRELMLNPVYAGFDYVHQAVEIDTPNYKPEFNIALKGKRFVLLDELQQVRNFQNDPNHWLKRLIGYHASPKTKFAGKGYDGAEFPDYANYIVLTNEIEALRLNVNQGRFWIAETHFKGDHDYYDRLTRWLLDPEKQRRQQIFSYLSKYPLDGYTHLRPRLEISDFDAVLSASEDSDVSDVRKFILEEAAGVTTFEQVQHKFSMVQDLKPLVGNFRKFKRDVLTNINYQATKRRKCRPNNSLTYLLYPAGMTEAEAIAIWNDQYPV